MSFDDVRTQAEFRRAQELEFSLLSDADGSVAAKYDVRMPGRPFARRVTFVIDETGVLRAIDDEVDVTTHGSDLAALIAKLRG